MPRDDCEHGNLRRKCELCEAWGEVERLRAERNEAVALLRDAREELSRWGWFGTAKQARSVLVQRDAITAFLARLEATPPAAGEAPESDSPRGVSDDPLAAIVAGALHQWDAHEGWVSGRKVTSVEAVATALRADLPKTLRALGLVKNAVTDGGSCSTCGGTGQVWAGNHRHVEPQYVPCPDCGHKLVDPLDAFIAVNDCIEGR